MREREIPEAKCVLPTPEGPKSNKFSPRCNQLESWAKFSNCAGLTLGQQVKSKLARDLLRGSPDSLR